MPAPSLEERSAIDLSRFNIKGKGTSLKGNWSTIRTGKVDAGLLKSNTCLSESMLRATQYLHLLLKYFLPKMFLPKKIQLSYI